MPCARWQSLPTFRAAGATRTQRAFPAGLDENTRRISAGSHEEALALLGALVSSVAPP
jgi:hypothetical protein